MHQHAFWYPCDDERYMLKKPMHSKTPITARQLKWQTQYILSPMNPKQPRDDRMDSCRSWNPSRESYETHWRHDLDDMTLQYRGNTVVTVKNHYHVFQGPIYAESIDWFWNIGTAMNRKLSEEYMAYKNLPLSIQTKWAQDLKAIYQ